MISNCKSKTLTLFFSLIKLKRTSHFIDLQAITHHGNITMESVTYWCGKDIERDGRDFERSRKVKQVRGIKKIWTVSRNS